MKKNLLKELILPAFWLFFFIVSSKSDAKNNELNRADNIELKNPDISSSEVTNGINNNSKAVKFTKALFLSGF